jgi:hypothetical protein
LARTFFLRLELLEAFFRHRDPDILVNIRT